MSIRYVVKGMGFYPFQAKAIHMLKLKNKIAGLTKAVSEWYATISETKYGKPLKVLKNSVTLFKNHDTFSLGAALSYYMIFSISPMLILVISMVGMIFGPEAVMGEIKAQAQGFIGSQGAEELQNMVKDSYRPGENIIATIAAAIVLLIGATSIFDQLRRALNTIWDIKPRAQEPWYKFLTNRLFSFAMIVCLAFLMLVSLVLQAAIAGFNNILHRWLANSSIVLLKILENGLSFGITIILFALIYKFMSDARLKWRSVWWGALFTAVLFEIGKLFISLYIGKTNVADTYGASGSLVVLLIWVFYSSQILFFGAEFTRALAIERGYHLDPKSQEPDLKVGIEGKEVIPAT